MSARVSGWKSPAAVGFVWLKHRSVVKDGARVWIVLRAYGEEPEKDGILMVLFFSV